MWEMWKRGFNAWEQTTAKYFEQVLSNPAILGPSGKVLSATMKAKAAGDKAMASWWGSMGLPTRQDQERTLHALNQLQSRIMDLEEKLEEAQRKG